MLPKLVAGDTLKFTVSLADFPAGDGWVLHYRLTPRATGGTARTFDAAASGDDYLVNVPAATTAAWAAGAYTCSAWVTLGTERYAVPSEGGQITIEADPSALPVGTDTRSQAERDLDAVTLLLSGKAASGMESYRIDTGGVERELRSYPLPELLALQRMLRGRVDAERAAVGLPALYGGAGGIRQIKVVMR